VLSKQNALGSVVSPTVVNYVFLYHVI